MPVKNPDLKINPTFRDLLPPPTNGEIENLKKSIAKEGCRDPIIVNQMNEIVDGHNRYAICQELGVPFEVRVMEFDSEAETSEWMIRNQMARRNLTDFYRAELALRLKNSFAENAKANQRASGGAVPLKSAKPVDTRKELASVAGVSPDTISKVEAIKKHADEATKAKLRKGDKGVSINSIYKQIQGQSATSKQANVTPTLLSPSTNDITTSESEKPKLSIPAPVVFPQQVPSGEHTGQSVLKILEDYHAELSAMTAYIEGATMMVSSVAESDLIVQRCNKIREQALALAASCEASRLANTKNAHISTPPNSVAIPVVMTPPPIR